jgi:hypothetical protein
VRFYSNPGHFNVAASLDLKTLPARVWTFLATLLVGQGLYETPAEAVPARFRVFRRADGSMHFLRELYVGYALRVFDSDFVVRQHHGRPVLFEVFVELGLEVAMELTVLEEGALSIRGKELLFRGTRVPAFGLEVEFISRALGTDLTIDGHLRMRPTTGIGRFFMYKVLRRPEELGCMVWK